MEVPVIKIGNSKDIRFSKSIFEKYNIKDLFKLIVEEDHIIIKPASKLRKGWDKAFENKAKNGDDHLLIEDISGIENLDEWK